MNIFGQDPSFWLAVAGATLLKLATSARKSLWQSAIAVFSAVFAAYFFTDAALGWFSLDPATYKNPMAALIALSGEGMMRLVLNVVNDPKQGINLYRHWRGDAPADIPEDPSNREE
ncbi:hypothetical protein MesoLjLc_50370 [Mesorhizobium sp. L-8-10]|uniref:hypothetical protein n=1 Tax=Mesorhizobium sp. L-8-10 TaxID=2744523 RepID=UPI001925DE5D|nr:hypothetical protein [Mesorhizobium sp. L-8-10]BCH33107.1 hypothetical protein MesoLjLc_50370 [Mesorhizobium sp. L-8-10]